MQHKAPPKPPTRSARLIFPSLRAQTVRIGVLPPFPERLSRPGVERLPQGLSGPIATTTGDLSDRHRPVRQQLRDALHPDLVDLSGDACSHDLPETQFCGSPRHLHDCDHRIDVQAVTSLLANQRHRVKDCSDPARTPPGRFAPNHAKRPEGLPDGSPHRTGNQRIKQFRGPVARHLEVKANAGQHRDARIADGRVVVDAQQDQVLGNKPSDGLAGGKHPRRNLVVGGENRASGRKFRNPLPQRLLVFRLPLLRQQMRKPAIRQAPQGGQRGEFALPQPGPKRVERPADIGQ